MASQTSQKDAATSQKIEHQHDTTCHDACNKLEAKLREEEWESKVHPGRYGTQSPEPHQEKTTKDPRANVARKESVSDAAERLEAKLYEEEWNNRPHGW